MSRRLEVLLHDQLVGTLSETPDGGTEFRFLGAYRDLVPRPVLGQKFEDDLDKVYRSRKRQRLPDFFANLIPEGRLRDLIEKTADLETGDDLALLDFVGQDLPGAVVVCRADDQPALPPSEEPESPSLEDGSPRSGEALRFSLAGVQLKFSMLLQENKLTLPAKGQSGEWIVKFDSPTFPHLTENELSMLEWAREGGFDVPECHLLDAEHVLGFPRSYTPRGTRVLAVRRYDRSATGRVHQEDFAQAVGLPPSEKYEHVTHETMARLVRRFIDEEAVGELVRRLVFVVASGNGDAHLKNWSLVYSGTTQARWSPLYDQVATIAWEAPARELALKLAGVKQFGRIDRAAFERFADKAEIERRRIHDLIDGTLGQLRQAWRKIVAEAPLPEAHEEALRQHWRKVPLLRDAGPLG